MTERPGSEWLEGGVTLEAAAGWLPDELRILSDLGYSLSEQGRDSEAVTVFEGLTAISPSTAYFQSALGALKLRTGDLKSALGHLDTALSLDPSDGFAMTNRGETLMSLGDRTRALRDLEAAIRLSENSLQAGGWAVRARALLRVLRETSPQLPAPDATGPVSDR